ncbi:hypothetical protein ANO11243_024230 [Dothideomycetidae sp. 11243]|nr:hypothetical protein ANO11243_024230 [fungal sp. No.11243]
MANKGRVMAVSRGCLSILLPISHQAPTQQQRKAEEQAQAQARAQEQEQAQVTYDCIDAKHVLCRTPSHDMTRKHLLPHALPHCNPRTRRESSGQFDRAPPRQLFPASLQRARTSQPHLLRSRSSRRLYRHPLPSSTTPTGDDPQSPPCRLCSACVRVHMTDNSRFWSTTPWRPLPDIVHAVCVRHFDAAGSDDLTLQLGDEVYITEVNGRENQWCRGWLLAHASIVTGLSAPPGSSLRPRAYAGIFPRCCVSVREVLTDPERSKAGHKARRHSRNASAPSAPLTNGTIAHSRSPSNPTNRSVHTSPSNGVLADSPDHSPSNSFSKPPKSTPSPASRQDSPLAPLVPQDVQPRPQGAPKEPAPLPALRIGDGGRADREPLVDDISSTIREWHSARLHNLMLRREYKTLDELSVLVDRLSDARRQLAHNLLTEQETRKLREQVVWDLVKGNKMVDGEVIVRSAAQLGRTLTAQDSLPEIADLQTVMSLRDRPVQSATKDTHLHHLLMQVKAVPQELHDPALLHMCLYSVSSSGKPRPVSEAFAVELAVEEGSSRVEVADRFSSTLFAELNKADVGGGDQSDSRLYLICRLIHDEPMHKAKPATPSLATSPIPQNGESEDHPNRGRLSFGRARSRRGSDIHDPSRSSTNATSRSALQLNAPSHKAGTSITTTSSDRPDSAVKTRRVAGWCAVSVSSLILNCASECLTLSFWVPTTPSDQVSGSPTLGEAGWEDVIKSMSRSASGSFKRSSTVGSLVLDLTAFAHDKVTSLVRAKPALLKNVQCTPALSLNGASKHQRSDIYMTLREPILPARARSYHPQIGSVPIGVETDLTNLQVTLEVRTSDGQRIDDAIHPTANRRPHTAFRSPAIERGEAWNQTIKLSISPKDLPNAHVIMSIADGANFPFALAWVPLWDRVNGFPPDGPQSLAFWDYCEYTANLIDGRGAYQSLPSRVAEMAEHQGPHMASITVETHLSSTKATQNADVLSLSSLDRASLESTTALLERFSSIPDEEIAKFFGPILMSLNVVLEQYSNTGSESTDGHQVGNRTVELAVRCLAHAVRLIHDRRYPHLEGLLDDYNSRRAPSVEARLGVLRSLRSVLSKPFDARGGRELRASLKVTDVLLRFALRHNPANEKEHQAILGTVQQEVIELLEDVIVLLSNTSHLALPSQVIIVQNIHAWIPEILLVCSGQDVLRFVAAAADTCARNHSPLWLHRISMIHNIFSLAPFQQEPLLSAIVDMTESWLLPVWPVETEVDETSTAALRLSVTIVREQQPYMTHAQCQRYMLRLFSAFYIMHQSESNSGSTSKTKQSSTRRRAFSPLFPTSHPFRTVSTTSDFVPSEVLLEVSTVLGTFFQDGLTASSLSKHESPHTLSAERIDELSAVDLAESLSVIRALQSSAAFPPSWLSLCVSMSRCTVNMLAWVLSHLRASLPIEAEDDGEAILDFDSTLWTTWFESLITLVTSNVVRMEEHSEQKRRAVWTIGGDIRESAALLLKQAWDSLGWLNDEQTKFIYGISYMGGYQVQFTSELIPSIVSLGLSLHLGLRTVAVEILKSMIVGEWELSGDLDVIRSALTDALDDAFRDARFEPNQARMLLDTLRERLDYLVSTGAVELHRAIAKMLSEIQVLVDMLLQVRDSAADHASQLEHRVKLLEHLRATNNEDSYLRHIHDVAEAQVDNKRYSSAALAMQLHVQLLKLRADPDVDVQLAKAYPDLQLPSQTFYQRRQMLYAAMVKFFRMGCCWSKVLSTLEIQRLELLASYDTANLAIVLREQSETYHKLSNGKGLQMPRYFKVAFSKHHGLPASVSGRSFIFEANPDDDTTHFARRLRQAYPTASVVHSGIASSAAENDVPKIHIISVHVNRDQLNPVNQRAGVSPFFRLHHLSSEPVTFSNSTRQQKPGLSVAEQTVAKTIYVTAEKFPTILGRAEIVKEEALILSSVEAAIDRVHRKTMDLAEVLLSSKLTDTSDNDKLVQAIRLSVDPASPDSIAAYHEILLAKDGSVSQRSSLSNQQSASANQEAMPIHATGSAKAAVHTRSTSATSAAAHAAGEHTQKAQLRALTVALQDHAQMLEHALASGFEHRLTVKASLRDALETTFEPELYGLYPDGKWRQHSPAWADTRARPAPPQRGESLFSNLHAEMGDVPIVYEMSGAAGTEAHPVQTALGRADSTVPGSDGHSSKVSRDVESGHRRLHSSGSAIEGAGANGRTDYSARPGSRRGSRRGLGVAESDTETEGKRSGTRRKLSLR